MTRQPQHYHHYSFSALTWLSCCLLAVEAFTTKTAFLGKQSWQSSRTTTGNRGMKMDMEEPFGVYTTSKSSSRKSLFQPFKVSVPQLKTRIQVPKPEDRHSSLDIDQALKQHGMPWKSSIDPTYRNAMDDTSTELFYMPFFEWQLQFMRDHLTNLRLVPTQSSNTGQDLTYAENADQKVRMVTYTFESDEYRKIRMTVYDAGNRTQVFTSLWYPREHYNLPVLGTDLLQFAGGARHLCVVDLQPLHKEQQEQANYEQYLEPIRDQYPSLQGQMTQRFYDETQHFSNQMLYSRFEELQQQPKTAAQEQEQQQHPAYRDLFPAYQQYVQTHLQLIRDATPNPNDIPMVRQGQAAYDAYSAVRDPAHGMFTKVFGQAFADAFVYDVLFSYSGDATQEEQ